MLGAARLWLACSGTPCVCIAGLALLDIRHVAVGHNQLADMSGNVVDSLKVALWK
jgi:hypothetical protein